MTSETDYPVRVIKEYEAPYPDPIQASAGEDVSVDLSRVTDIPGWVWCTNHAGKGGWVPATYIEVEGERGRMLYDYNAIELTVHVDEVLTVHNTESGFHWVTNQNGQEGWVPVAHVEPTGE
jgi:hypothetical protein